MPRITKPPFTIIKRSKTSRARLGTLKTPHGTIQTPAYVIVATSAEVKTLKPSDIKKTKTQIVISNTYHLWNRAENDKLQVKNDKSKKSFITRNLKVAIPTMTDSGGFQVFSLGAAKNHDVGKVLKRSANSKLKTENLSAVRISEKGVSFNVDGDKRFLSPEISMSIQERLGADIIFAFDECTSPLHPQDYTRKSMERTHRWAARCLKAHTREDQLLYGIVQGGRFKRLRVASAKAIGSMPFGGFGIGGSFGKDEMVSTLAAVIPNLPDEKPRHLLGIGTVQDIFSAVEAGVDTMDCVIPTREARHARLYTDDGVMDIRKSIYASDANKISPDCDCLACQKINRMELRALFKAHDNKAGRFATLHNVYWFNNLLENIRAALSDGSYGSFKKKFLTRFIS